MGPGGNEPAEFNMGNKLGVGVRTIGGGGGGAGGGASLPLVSTHIPIR